MKNERRKEEGGTRIEEVKGLKIEGRERQRPGAQRDRRFQEAKEMLIAGEDKSLTHPHRDTVFCSRRTIESSRSRSFNKLTK